MDEIVLKWVTVLSGILTVIVCVSVFFFPDIHERAVLAAEQQKEVGGGNLIATTANPKAVVEQSKDLNTQLKITLPEGISKADVEIENDYVTQTIYIKFAGVYLYLNTICNLISHGEPFSIGTDDQPIG